jgi:exodeoxyribonuclease III
VTGLTAPAYSLTINGHPIYWDFFRNAFERNFGWRIDHIMATNVLAARCHTAEVDMAPRKVASASDHTVVWAEFD